VLVAELGSAFLSADLGVTADPRDDHSSYLASWLDVLKNDNRAIFTAAAYAQRPAEYLHGVQHEAIGAVASAAPIFGYSDVQIPRATALPAAVRY
jgi:antirestriction protein ArdC